MIQYAQMAQKLDRILILPNVGGRYWKNDQTIQWRMELGNPLNMPKCAEKLISRLEDLKKVYNTKNIYFATDYPLKDSLRQSFSFHDIKQEYHGKAIDILRDNVNFFSWFNFTPTDQFGNNMNIKEFALSGIPGILDKIVCTRAKIFLIAPPECRKKTSSYTSMINSERFDLMKANVEGIENISLEWYFMVKMCISILCIIIYLIICLSII
uniref:Uncharacterized protein n=1 Tax=Rhizophagus irregularis (strain DAOM 181602 / DAOM 197198 / MUCL 43194) TaxID=747089 RepID=U9TH00_RHIID